MNNDPGNAEAWYLLSEACLHQDKTTAITDTLNLAPQEVKDEPYYNVALGNVFLHANFPAKAKSYFNVALEKTKEKDAGVLSAIAKADIDNNAGDANEAVNLLNKAIKRDKHNPALYTLLGNAYRKLKDGSTGLPGIPRSNKRGSKVCRGLSQYRNDIRFPEKPGNVFEIF